MTGLLLAAWIGCQAFDTTSTLRMMGPHYAEGNPLYRNNRAAVAGIKVTVNLIGVAAWMRSEKTHRAVPLIFAGAGCAAGTWNATRSRR